MPLPSSPTQRPNPTKAGKAAQALSKSRQDLLLRGIFCVLIGLGVLLSPYFINSPGMQSIVAKSALVGWFALVLGLAFIGLYLRQRMAPPAPPK
ncbi:MAG: hypothetical protein JWP47_2516 [Polaromonas sp.]|nr:hypothetical protein [Polaromonas sp.]